MKNKLTLLELKQIVDEVFNVDSSNRCRENIYLAARNTIYDLVHKHCGYHSLQSIGHCLGLNHATVLNGINKKDNFFASYKYYSDLRNLSDAKCCESRKFSDERKCEKLHAEILQKLSEYRKLKNQIKQKQNDRLTI